MRRSAFFDTDSDDRILSPLPTAGSGWNGGQMRGVAVSAVLARGVERRLADLGPDRLRPARWTVDLFHPVAMRPCSVETEIVRAGKRLRLVDARLLQDGQPVAAARALFLAAGSDPAGDCWSAGKALPPPPASWRRSEDRARVYYSDDAGWDADPAQHHNRSRNRLWHGPIDIVTGEEPSPFQFACGVADVSNLVANLGTHGLEYINADVTVAFSRLPIGGEMGISATDRQEYDGISVGTAVLYDRLGAFGSSTVTAITAPAPADLRVASTASP
ncbi:MULTISPECIES: acyl-CoA thioesterase domain-containing protein [Nocardia]|uniref:acyl-CoA thioesterase domain-containing protein n=1 Tax=Nocardia TaxID=1817 RepID=UPI00082FC013|nr:acyl-CoA thioesterase domain-containing protein [Nocardia beijingensis]